MDRRDRRASWTRSRSTNRSPASPELLLAAVAGVVAARVARPAARRPVVAGGGRARGPRRRRSAGSRRPRPRPLPAAPAAGSRRSPSCAGMAHARLPVDPQRIGTLLAVGVPGLAIAAILGGMVTEPWRGDFLEVAQAQVLLFLVTGVSALALARLGEAGRGRADRRAPQPGVADAARRPRPRRDGARDLGRRHGGVDDRDDRGRARRPAARRRGSSSASTGGRVRILFDQRGRRWAPWASPSARCPAAGRRPARRHGRPGRPARPRATRRRRPASRSALLAVVLIASVVVVMLLAGLWLRRKGGGPVDDDEDRVIDRGGELDAPPRRTVRRFAPSPARPGRRGRGLPRAARVARGPRPRRARRGRDPDRARAPPPRRPATARSRSTCSRPTWASSGSRA